MKSRITISYPYVNEGCATFPNTTNCLNFASIDLISSIFAHRNGFIFAHQNHSGMANHDYLGMWVTGDGYIRQELLATGRYDEARGNRKIAYMGRYKITGSYIYYWDDTGFEADGNFDGGDTLHHGGYIFYREKKK